MDGYSSKRSVNGTAAAKKRSVSALKDTAASEDASGQMCSRIGCCGRLNHYKGPKSKPLEKPKTSKPTLRSSSSKETTPNPSKNCSSVTNVKGTEKKPSTKIEPIPKESKNVTVESEVHVTNQSKSRTQLKLKSKSPISDQSSESSNGRRKRFTQGESSSSGKGKKVVSVSPVSEPRKSKTSTAGRTGGFSSVKSQRSTNQLHGDDFSLVKSTEVIPEMPETQELTANDGGSTSDTSSTTSSANSTERSVIRFVNDRGTRNYNIDGIADVLLALNRLEQDEVLTIEQLLSLETNLFLGGLNFYDQHRDMRLDIDNMSYEELLVLEERMGTVSTALSEEDVSKCVKTSVYESMQLGDGKMKCSLGVDDRKCSICQEEFVKGDEIGSLGCGHGYHTPCVKQWLQLKKWCPICKAEPQP
ncbi:uncharacterized protein [Rutidosis leptorrhynchoides]|uniref:uncharacterized protein n=1 Tax=Rutidosis leptorrhynchoides TaxID=125765 RepID=UPI003A997D95